ncbi:MAG: hypothetical protein V3T18_06925, partial [Pseudomonadales bacterium]
MQKFLKTSVLAALVLLAPAGFADLKEAVEAAMASDIRTEAEKARDANRKPAETLAFFQMTEDMRVLELLPGGGWYTKILAPVLEDNGKLFVTVGAQRVEALIADGTLNGVEVIETAGEFVRDTATRRFHIEG